MDLISVYPSRIHNLWFRFFNNIMFNNSYFVSSSGHRIKHLLARVSAQVFSYFSAVVLIRLT